MSSVPMGLEAARGRRRLRVVTAGAIAALGLQLSLYGVFAAWAISNAVADTLSPVAIAGCGLLVGCAGATAFVLTELTRAKVPVEQFLAQALVDDPHDPRVHRVGQLVAGVSIAAGIDAPRVHVVRHRCPNALAIGTSPESTDLYVTTGLLRLLDRDEQEAVIASVMTSIARFDVALGTVGYGVGSGLKELSTVWLSRDPRTWIVTAGLAPFWLAGWATRRLVLRWTGAARDADAMGLTRHPPALYTALVKLRDDDTDLGPVPADTGHLWFEHPTFEHDRQSGKPRRLSTTLDRRIEQVAIALRQVDSSWVPPDPRLGDRPSWASGQGLNRRAAPPARRGSLGAAP